MKTIFLGSFLSDVKKIREARMRRAIADAIQNVESVDSVEKIRSIKRLSGHREYYRIRVGDWRVGLKINDNTVTFVRCLHRREVYRFFP